MKQLEFYIFKRLWGPFLAGVFGTTLIIALDPMQKSLDYIFNNNIHAGIVWVWFINSLPKDMLFIFPTASLLAGLFVYAGLSRNSELVAVYAGGISFLQTLRPLVFFACMAFVLVVYLQEWVIPPALKKRNDIFRRDIKQYEEPRLRKDVLLRLNQNRLLSVGEIDLASFELKNLVIREYAEGSRIVSAKKAVLLTSTVWQLSDAYESILGQAEVSEAGILNRFYPVLQVDLGMDQFDFAQYEERRSMELSYRDLLAQIKYHDLRGVISTIPLQVDFYNKTAFPFATIIFLFMGACLGVSSHRTGGFTGFGISLLLTFVYFFLGGLFGPLGKNGVLSPFLAGWSHNLVFLGVSLWLIYRVQNR